VFIEQLCNDHESVVLGTCQRPHVLCVILKTYFYCNLDFMWFGFSIKYFFFSWRKQP